MPRHAIFKPTLIDDQIILEDIDKNRYICPTIECTNVAEIAIRQCKNVSLWYETKNNQFCCRKTGLLITKVDNFLELNPFLFNIKNKIEFTSEAPIEIKSKIQNISKIQDIKHFIHTSIKMKPYDLIMSDSKWKYLIRSILRGKNVLITGASGCGKTIALLSACKAFPDRPQFFIPLGSTQDPRTTLIGNTHFNKETGTIFNKSYFVKAIETPFANIILDEISRAHPEAGNILMSVLDYNQRFLRLDEEFDTPTINVAEGVTFMSTANIGAEYTYTRKLDRALIDRFSIIEMDILTKNQELELLKLKNPDIDLNILSTIAEIADNTRTEILKPDAKIQTFISTRNSLEIASLINDGFSLHESADVHIYPLFSNNGGESSERTFVKQMIQQYMPNIDIVNF